MRIVYLVCGIVAVALGAIGVVLPLLPTVPFLLLAAFCFARSNKAWEQRILDHPVFGRHVRAWRETGAISAWAKTAAVVSLVASAGFGIWSLDGAWRLLPPAIALATATFILTRPTA